jgi:hypothetical protein
MIQAEDLILKEMKDHAETLKKLKQVEIWALMWKQLAKKACKTRDNLKLFGKAVTDLARELETERDALQKQVAELEEYQEKLLCENEIHEQCIANIIDTKPGGSIEGQMIAATQMCGRAEQREEKLMIELAALKKDARRLVCETLRMVGEVRCDCYPGVRDAMDRIIAATDTQEEEKQDCNNCTDKMCLE